MAQKQFKIGLSNTDKQNMAQDVYERVLALTFNEYDTTTEYDVGDFVVYNDQLYKCIGATSGAWDSTKWQLATLNDLVDDIENAVAFVNDKANVDGNYPTMTVGVADQLSPYDENSGDDQDEPFNFQATGTGNGTQPDFATGSIALMKEKQGNTVVVNQYVPETAYSDSASDISFSKPANSHIYTISGTASANVGKTILDLSNNIPANHKVLFNFPKYTNAGTNSILLYLDNTYANSFRLGSSNPTRIITTQNPLKLIASCNNGDVIDYEFELEVIDLTQWFNGDIPQDILDTPSNFFRYYQGSLAYNEGTLVNANGRYIKCIGMNQWDEEWELGVFNTTTGANTVNNNQIRTKNKIRVLPNVVYYCKVPNNLISTNGQGAWVIFYDKNENVIPYNYGSIYVHDGNSLLVANQTFRTPNNAYYMKFYMTNNYGATYNNDISINLYYENEQRCLTYEPYEVLTNNDTGVEVLRKAGNVADIKLPSGEIKRNVGVVDLGSLQWSPFTDAVSTGGLHYSNSNFVVPDIDNVRCVIEVKATSGLGWQSTTPCFAYNNETDKTLRYYGTTLPDFSGIMMYYELADADKTTEQGTPYSENLVIDDFGSMDFAGNNGVPQGNLIFYPVDYKAFVDTLYKYTDGTPSNIALKSDVASEQSARETQDVALLNAVGGTLRQCLVLNNRFNEVTVDFLDTDFVDMGDLSWSYNSQYQVFFCGTLAFDSSITVAFMSTMYKYSNNDMGSFSNLEFGWHGGGVSNTIWVKNTSYTDATAFKNAMKGVLLAYKKASS